MAEDYRAEAARWARSWNSGTGRVEAGFPDGIAVGQVLAILALADAVDRLASALTTRQDEQEAPDV